MLERSTENENGKVKLRLEVENMSQEVSNMFLKFLYSGNFNVTPKGGPSTVEPTWVKLIPKLINMAHEVSELISNQ